MKNQIENLSMIISNLENNPYELLGHNTIINPDESGIFHWTWKNTITKDTDEGLELIGDIEHELNLAFNDYLLNEGTFTYNLNRQEDLHYNDNIIIWTNDYCDTIQIQFADDCLNITIYQSGQY